MVAEPFRVVFMRSKTSINECGMCKNSLLWIAVLLVRESSAWGEMFVSDSVRLASLLVTTQRQARSAISRGIRDSQGIPDTSNSFRTFDDWLNIGQVLCPYSTKSGGRDIYVF